MKKTILVIFLYALLWLGWSSIAVDDSLAAAQNKSNEFFFRYIKIKDPQTVHIKASGQAGRKLPDKPPSLKKTPKCLSDDSAWFVAWLGGEKTYMALDPNHRLLGIDMNCDNSLGEDEVFKGEVVPPDPNSATRNPNEVYLQFGPIYLQLWQAQTTPPKTAKTNVDGNPGSGDLSTPADTNETEGVWFFVETHAQRYLVLYLAGYREGKIPCGKGPHKILLLDGNFDGVYTPKVGSKTATTDKIAIDLNNDGLFRREEIFPLQERMGVQGRCYQIATAFDGAIVSMVEYQPRLFFGESFAKSEIAYASLPKCRAGG